MNYEESIAWLFEQFPAYQNLGASAYKPDLDNVLALCTFFEVDYKKLKCIHIAGTNGKGSTSNYLASILSEASYKTGLFTSPHILDFRERIRVNGAMISEEKVIDFCVRVQNSKFDIQPSFFEITWVLALMHFLDSDCDICIIETGLGGRLDATNIIQPMLSIITNIGLDHTAILGESIEKIAFEKAGIIKENTPVLIGESDPITKKIFEETAKAKNAPLYFCENFTQKAFFFPEHTYQRTNERTVRCALEILNRLDFHLQSGSVETGLKHVFQNTGFMGRFQLLSEKPLLLVDAAHNREGIQSLLASIRSYDFERLHIIYGASNDKAVEEIITLFPDNSQLHLTCFSNPRSKTLKELAELKSKSQKINAIHASIEETFHFIQSSVNEKDMILVTGSFFLLSDFFTFFSKKTC